MHPRFAKADRLSGAIIGAAIRVDRIMGPGWLESIDNRCPVRTRLEQKETKAKKKECSGSSQQRQLRIAHPIFGNPLPLALRHRNVPSSGEERFREASDCRKTLSGPVVAPKERCCSTSIRALIDVSMLPFSRTRPE
jgi:hypothetical protein